MLTLDDAKQCPFCGHPAGGMEAELLEVPEHINVWVLCSNCDAGGPWAKCMSYQPKEELESNAVSAWNERPAGGTTVLHPGEASPHWK